MLRLYISKLVGDGLTLETAFRPAWIDVVGNVAHQGQAIDSEKHLFCIGILDTDDTQHGALQADNRIRYIDEALFNLTYQELTPAQKAAALEVLSYLNLRTDIFSNNAKVLDILAYITGRCLFHPIKTAIDADV